MITIPPSWLSILIPSCYNAIIAMGLYFSNYAGSFSIAHAALAGAGGYASAIVTTKFGGPFWLALIVGAFVGLLIGFFIAYFTRGMNAMTGGLATMAMGQVMSVIAYNSSYLGGAHSLIGVPFHTTLGTVLIFLLFIIYLSWRFERSRFGYSALACREDIIASSSMGISVKKTRIICFVIGATIAGLGGAFRVHYVGVQNPGDLEFDSSFNYLIFWVFGGSYSFVGPALGAIVLTILPELLRFSINERYILYGLVLVILVILRPNGLIPRTPQTITLDQNRNIVKNDNR